MPCSNRAGQGVSRGVFPRPETKLLDVFSQIMKAFVSSSLGNCSGLSGNAPFKRGKRRGLDMDALLG